MNSKPEDMYSNLSSGKVDSTLHLSRLYHKSDLDAVQSKDSKQPSTSSTCQHPAKDTSKPSIEDANQLSVWNDTQTSTINSNSSSTGNNNQISMNGTIQLSTEDDVKHSKDRNQDSMMDDKIPPMKDSNRHSRENIRNISKENENQPPTTDKNQRSIEDSNPPSTDYDNNAPIEENSLQPIKDANQPPAKDISQLSNRSINESSSHGIALDNPFSNLQQNLNEVHKREGAKRRRAKGAKTNAKQSTQKTSLEELAKRLKNSGDGTRKIPGHKSSGNTKEETDETQSIYTKIWDAMAGLYKIAFEVLSYLAAAIEYISKSSLGLLIMSISALFIFLAVILSLLLWAGSYIITFIVCKNRILVYLVAGAFCSQPSTSISTWMPVADWTCSVPGISLMSYCQPSSTNSNFTDDFEVLMSSQDQIRAMKHKSDHGESLSNELMVTVDTVGRLRIIIETADLPEPDEMLEELGRLGEKGEELHEELLYFFVQVRDVVIRVNGENIAVLRRVKQLEQQLQSPFHPFHWMPERWGAQKTYESIAQEYVLLLKSNENKVLELRKASSEARAKLLDLKQSMNRLQLYTRNNYKPLQQEEDKVKDAMWVWKKKAPINIIRGKIDVLDNLEKDIQVVLDIVNQLNQALQKTYANLKNLLNKAQNPQFDWSPKTMEEALDYLRIFVQRIQVSVHDISQHAGQAEIGSTKPSVTEVTTKPAKQTP
ncbi:hypothetical protein F4819DRAFT_508812 [Hypoxylon fuscum]|nr:hypothetical protein F4819DRAFT_508812 [Hypoxylon fuscum]